MKGYKVAFPYLYNKRPLKMNKGGAAEGKGGERGIRG